MSEVNRQPSTAIEPRGLSRVRAAEYLGISPSLFDDMVRDGRMPRPKRINSRTVWDRRQLDDFFEALPGGHAMSKTSRMGPRGTTGLPGTE
jgi:predicted DNA-binding transcriptional regulator AlpA